jgi:sugar O-acyltransferase (sialic acid O-acetyltransferase NeuD family)
MSGGELHIVGAGGYARCVADIALATSVFEKVVFYDRDAGGPTSMLGAAIKHEASLFNIAEFGHVIVALGDNSLRQKVVDKIMKARPDLVYPTLIHPRASVSPYSRGGAGTVIMAGAVVGPNAVLGNHVSIYSSAVVEHDCHVADFVTLAPSATLGGTVKVGLRSFIGLGATVNHGVVIGEDTIVGAGAAVVRDCAGSKVLMGVPAKETRLHEPGNAYL